MVQNQTTWNWDDLRVVLAVARAGSLRGAARVLRVSHSTVLRRLQELESAARVRLFERSGERFELTNAGHDVIHTSEEVEDALVSLERRVQGRDQSLSGPVRVTLPDPLLPALLPVFRSFQAKYPEIDTTIDVSVQFLDLAQREADVALRIAGEPPADLVGRRVATIACAVYGTERYLKARSRQALERLDWVGWPANSRMEFAQWLQANVPKARIALRLDGSWAVRDAVDADLGVTLFPCALGDVRRGWQRVRLVPEVSAPLWILTHKDLRATARVRALRDVLWEAITRDRDLYEGKRASEKPKRRPRPSAR
jgi:DNA-binding transcriptional LysR family regulator